jgi:uncharacterized protein
VTSNRVPPRAPPSSETVGTVSALRRYPVKSLRGEDLTAAEVGPGGLVGDRTHAVIDRHTGKVGSAKNPRLWRALLTMSASACQASMAGDGGDGLPEVRITLPGGAVVSSGDPRVHQLLSDVLERPVRLADELPPGAGLERADPLAVLSHGVDAEVPIVVGSLDRRNGHPERPASFVDYAPVHLSPAPPSTGSRRCIPAAVSTCAATDPTSSCGLLPAPPGSPRAPGSVIACGSGRSSPCRSS